MLDSLRMQAVQWPIIPIVGEMIRNHPGTISLGQGVVSYGPPPEAIQHIQTFLANPTHHKYQAVVGISPLRDAIAHKLQHENGIDLGDRQQVVVTAGSNMAFMNTILAITSPGDEVILLTPYYFNHEMAIVMASCRPVLVATDDRYQPRIEAIRQAITPKTRAIVTISPNNPTGAVYPEATLRAINELCRVHQLYHISDETYEYFTYGVVSHFSPASIPQAADYTIALYSLSKAYGFASWRIGYMVIPSHLLAAVEKVQDTIVICPPVISQYAALGALTAGRDYCRPYIETIAVTRQLLLQQFTDIANICTLPTADGAFYLLLNINTYIPALTLVEQLIQRYQVAVIPGNTFGIETGCYLRLAYAGLEQPILLEGINRLVQGLRALVGCF